MEDKKFFVMDENGVEVEYEIILTFKSPETNKNYVIYKLPEEEEEVLAAIYSEDEGQGGTLLEIETEEEFQMIQDVLDAFMDEEDE